MTNNSNDSMKKTEIMDKRAAEAKSAFTTLRGWGVLKWVALPIVGTMGFIMFYVAGVVGNTGLTDYQTACSELNSMMAGGDREYRWVDEGCRMFKDGASEYFKVSTNIDLIIAAEGCKAMRESIGAIIDLASRKVINMAMAEAYCQAVGNDVVEELQTASYQ